MSTPDWEDVLDIMEDQAEEMAWFCLGTGIAPSEYRQLTRIEVAAFVKVQTKMNKRKGE